MLRICRQCSASFAITDDDLAFYEKVSPVFNGKKELIPPPTLCPDCRQQRRLSYRNERSLHHRTCDRCAKSIVSVYAPETDFTVYCPECWWGDGWDSRSYGRDIDCSRPIFPQIRELLHAVPLLSNNVFNSVNAEYNSFCVDSKDVYLSQRIGNSERIAYCYLPLFCLSCTDCYALDHCELCYECINCWNCYNARFSQLCRDCSSITLCRECIGCKDCFGCINLRNAQYRFFQEQLTKEEYERRIAALPLARASGLRELITRFQAAQRNHPIRALFHVNSEDAVGDYLMNARDIFRSYDVDQSETVRHAWGVEYSRDIGDSEFIYYGERCFENLSNSKSMNIFFSYSAQNGTHDIAYSLMCLNGTHDCFACASLNRKEYCILNKQYTKEEYEDLVPKIIGKMRANGEWGEFFPVEMSPFAYNEAVAQEYFSLSKEEVEKRGWRWRDTKDELPKVERIIPATQLPDSIDDIPDDILHWAIECEVSKRPFKIIKQELEFYRTMHLPIPRFHPDERHCRRMALRNPRKLWDRACSKCGKAIATSYAPERPEIVYCEECYLKEVY